MTEWRDLPMVSVIMPSCNSAEFIAPAIESVLAQTYPKLELIVVDDRSTDGTVELIKTFGDSRIKLFRGDFGHIIAKSRNHAAKNADGEFLAFLDSDDAWVPSKLESQLTHFANPEVCCVASDFLPSGDVVRFVNHLAFQRNQLYQDFGHRQVLAGNPVVMSSAVVRAKDFNAFGMFDEDPVFFALEDWELWMRFSKHGKIRVLADPLVSYRIAFSKKRDIRKVALHGLEAVRRNADPSLPPSVVRAACGNCHASIGRAFLEYGDVKGVSYYLKGLCFAGSLMARLRCVWGLGLFALPVALRKRVMKFAYRVHAIKTMGVARSVSLPTTFGVSR